MFSWKHVCFCRLKKPSKWMDNNSRKSDALQTRGGPAWRSGVNACSRRGNNSLMIFLSTSQAVSSAHDRLHHTAGTVTAQRAATMAASHWRKSPACQAFTPRASGTKASSAALFNQSSQTEGLADVQQQSERASWNLLEVIFDSSLSWLTGRMILIPQEDHWTHKSQLWSWRAEKHKVIHKNVE